jgi:hypothetical protein
MKTLRKRPRVPYCYSCYDKGWNSYLSVQRIGSDFDFVGGDRMIEKRLYCGCKKGQKLKKLENNN